MASSIPPYQHGPGPSGYYAQPPPPSQYNYGTNGAGPGPNPYQYQYPAPPPMNSHPHPAPVPQGPPPRINGRGGGPYNPSRGFQNIHQNHPPQFSHGPPLPGHLPNVQHLPQHNPYPQQHPKYAQPYQQQYHYHQPPQGPYSPSWTAPPQPASPIQKQLATPPPPVSYYQQPPPPPPVPVIQPQQNIINTANTPNDANTDINAFHPLSPINVPYPSSLISASSPPPLSPLVISTETSSTAPTMFPRILSPTSANGSLSSPKKARETWVIWSRRPQDPIHAPGIIFSSRSNPPPNVVAKAMTYPSPPRTPVLSPVVQSTEIPLTTFEDPSDSNDSHGSPPVSSHPTSTVPSSSVTETTDTPTVPGSPVSTNTSVSLAGTPLQDTKSQAAETSTTAEASADSAPQAESIPSSEPAAAGPVSSPTPPTPAPAPVKKSWASLLRPAGSSSTAGSSSSRNGFPTSSVVGFSIPATPTSASDTNDTLGFPITPSKKAELIALLTPPSSSSAPSVATASSAPIKIRPRGLVNTGNMCFANSVLQVLIYCPPFYRLFHELGKLIPRRSAGRAGKDGQGGDADAEGKTPLVDATVEFLREFVEEEKEKKGKNGRMTLKETLGGGSSSRGKGKERDLSGDEDDEWDESFIPTYVYDALKEKKRFDHMRGGHQEDAEEFFGFFLDTLEEELLSIANSISPVRASKTPAAVEETEEEEPPQEDGWLEVGKRNRTVVTRTIKTTESPITRIFGGKFRSTLRAPQQKDSVVVEDWRSLRLDIQRDQIHTIQDALSYISHPQSVQMTHSTRPGVIVEASQQVLIEALPPVLVLHMKRFCYDTTVGGVVKVSKQVRFGPELEIGADIMAPSAKKQSGIRYKLFGAVYHHGLSASGGHYTLDVLHPTRFPPINPTQKPREGWIRIDDELVSDVRSEDVFDAFERDDTRCAYLLFYRRIR